MASDLNLHWVLKKSRFSTNNPHKIEWKWPSWTCWGGVKDNDSISLDAWKSRSTSQRKKHLHMWEWEVQKTLNGGFNWRSIEFLEQTRVWKFKWTGDLESFQIYENRVGRLYQCTQILRDWTNAWRDDEPI